MSIEASIVILAFDPGEHAGVAILDGDKLQLYTAANGSTYKSLLEPVKHFSLNDTAHCVIENGWGHRSGGMGPLTLARRRGLAQAVAETIGVLPRNVHYVHSATWQNKLFGGIHGKDTKELSMAFCRDTYGITPVSHDVADAICQATYWRRFGEIPTAKRSKKK